MSGGVSLVHFWLLHMMCFCVLHFPEGLEGAASRLMKSKSASDELQGNTARTIEPIRASLMLC
jgi:hypothetical protein